LNRPAEITVEEARPLLEAGSAALFLDVREPFELDLVKLPGPFLSLPMSDLAARGPAALPEDLRADPARRIIVVCHHGVRSLQVTAWLERQGFSNVASMAGGVDAWARRIDPAIGVY
jgi:rhodanese-related sulfurtransferase